jgi:hypothetical protein
MLTAVHLSAFAEYATLQVMSLQEFAADKEDAQA